MEEVIGSIPIRSTNYFLNLSFECVRSFVRRPTCGRQFALGRASKVNKTWLLRGVRARLLDEVRLISFQVK
jgi:hypothetical protein